MPEQRPGYEMIPQVVFESLQHRDRFLSLPQSFQEGVVLGVRDILIILGEESSLAWTTINIGQGKIYVRGQEVRSHVARLKRLQKFINLPLGEVTISSNDKGNFTWRAITEGVDMLGMRTYTYKDYRSKKDSTRHADFVPEGRVFHSRSVGPTNTQYTGLLGRPY